jgi:hypothetical protein
MERGELIIGIDDSNHAGDTKGEIIVVTFSYNHDDSIVRNFPNTRDPEEVNYWLNDSINRRDYRFTILPDEQFRRRHNNLPLVTPHIIGEFYKEEQMKLGEKLDLEVLKVYFDGPLKKEDKNAVKNFINLGAERIVVDAFVKKGKSKSGRVKKHPNCPRVVYMADIIANHLYRTKTAEELFKDERMIHVPLENIIGMIDMIGR